MTTLRITLCVLGIALVTSSASLAKKKSWDEIGNELAGAKLTASQLVGEFNATQPSKDDSVLMRRKYDLARESYFNWAEEAADSVEHGKDVKLKTIKANDARQRLKELGDFAKKYAQNGEKENVLLLRAKSKTSTTSANFPVVLSDANNLLNLVKAIEELIKGQRDRTAAERKAAADNIMKGAEWPDFASIK